MKTLAERFPLPPDPEWRSNPWGSPHTLPIPDARLDEWEAEALQAFNVVKGRSKLALAQNADAVHTLALVAEVRRLRKQIQEAQ